MKQKKQLPPPRRVLIATPVAADGAVSIYYVDSLINSIRVAASHNVELYPVYLANDVLIQRARNSLIAIAIANQCDELVWIDSDVQWQPYDLFKLLEYPVDVVGGTYPKKGPEEQYPVQVLTKSIPIDKDTGLLEVAGLGTGFLRMSRTALLALWDSNPEYKNNGNVEKWICEVKVERGEIIGEDIVLCHKLTALGFKIYLDKNICCNHIGMKTYTSNFSEYLKTLQK